MKRLGIFLLSILSLAVAQSPLDYPFATPIQSNVLTFADGEASATFTVGSSSPALFRVFGFEDMTFELVLPDGSSLNAASAQAAGWESVVVSPEDVGPLVAPVTTLYLAKEAPRPGDYTLTIRSSSPPTTAIAAQLLAASADNVVVRNALLVGEPGSPRLIFSQGEEIPVVLAVFADQTPVQGLTIKAEANSKNGTKLPVTLTDDGRGDDATANDGLYSGVFVPSQTGNWVLRAAATDGSAAAVSRLYVATPDIRLTGEVSDRSIDLDGDGRTDGIELTFGTTGTRGGDVYFISAGLKNAEGQTLVRSNRVEGGQALTLYFPVLNPDNGPSQTLSPKALEAIGVASVYDIIDARLNVKATLEGEELNRLLDYVPELGQTADYSSRLERDNTVIEGIRADSGVDLDGNGAFDRLDVTVAVDILLSGRYGASAQLTTQDGKLLATAALPSIDLSPTSGDITFSFDGLLIGASGEAGPYEVTNVLVYPNFSADASTTAVADSIGLLSGYSAFDFEGGLPGDIPSLIAFVETIVIDSPGNSAKALRRQLIKPLSQAQDELDRGRVEQARNRLNTFLNKVNAQAGKKLSEGDVIIIRQAVSYISDRLN